MSVNGTDQRCSPPDHMDDCGTVYSNFDHTFETEERELVEAGTHFGRHAAREFNGTIWKDGDVFIERIWRYHAVIDTLEAPTLEQLVSGACEQYGSE